MHLQFRTRGMSDPKGKPKVYFSCHPKDFEEAFSLISEDLLNHANCAVWYDMDLVGTSDIQTNNMDTAPAGGSDGFAETELEDILKEMQLIVFGVTSKFIHESHRAKDVELPIALRNHVPVLPIMLENGLGYEFSNNCAKIQVVPKYGTDPTAIPYEEVLQTFLDSVLVGDELAEQVRSGQIDPEDIDDMLFEQQLYTRESPDVDLLIRTSGEQRLSNFLPWQTTYAEFIFDPINWPEFNRARYLKCLQQYADRDRRFGGVKTDASGEVKA